MAPHSSTLAWKIPWTEEPGRLQSMGSLRVNFIFIHIYCIYAYIKCIYMCVCVYIYIYIYIYMENTKLS